MTIEERWEAGVPHHKESIKLFKAIRKIDEDQCEGQLDLKAGGDGDLGEELMYRMDVHFSQKKPSTLSSKMIELIASKVHQAWMEKKKSQGYEVYVSSIGENLYVPYADLSEEQKELDRTAAHAVIEGIEETGRIIVKY